jgi:heme-degrading monooxygenase HmoA
MFKKSDMILQIIKLKSKLPEEELLKKAKEREPQFKAIPGLLQKYYVNTAVEGEYGGVYVWDSIESMQAFGDSDLAKSIPKAYEMYEAPNIEMMDILFQLKE